MPSDTNPLPAAQLRTAEDARYKRLQVALYAHRHDAFITCPESCWCWEVDAVLTEHETALAASPVTLEEYLVREMHEADEAIADAGSPRPDELTKRWNTVAAQLKRHARRLAGERGA